MRRNSTVRFAMTFVAALFACLVAASARAQEEKLTFGTVGQASANMWPTLIGIHKGFFAAEGIKPDILYVQSSAALVQQLAAGSLDISISTGLVDALRATGMGAPIAIVRLEVQAPPYDLVAKPSIKSLADLRGKLISLGGPKDITRIYVERMLAAHGVKRGDFDMVFAGATSARTAALVAGAVDAAILLPAFNFQAIDKGFHSLGLTVDYVRELPFTGVVVNVGWAKSHKSTLQKILRAENRSIAWFEDDKNRDEAVQILQTASGLTQNDTEKAYDFFRNGDFFERSGRVSKAKLTALAQAMESLGDSPKEVNLDKVILPGITETTN
jgi:ABC-type nitrate/sulfonate/bicarbonate transport system substrate-binding protein